MQTFKQFLLEEDKIGAKKLGDNVPEWTPANAESDYRVGEVTFSCHDGLGQVPNNESVYHFGFVAWMRPSTFAEVAMPHESANERAKGIAKLILKGYAMGPPFLEVSFGEHDNGPVKITGHDGPARMVAIQMANGDEPVPVHCFLRNGLRGDCLTEKMEGYATRVKELTAGCFAQGTTRYIRHPFQSVYAKGKKVF
jgi:hypothetical protein